MPHERHDTRTIDRRSFVKASLIPAAVLANPWAQGAEPDPGPVPAGPDII
jgi:hypothetical protein